MDKICSIGHRGIAAEAPENTLASFARAIELSPDMIECDVRHTKDDNLIIMHV
ncbi:MAG TPA: glycerophosphodiester phosphodiesterase, partial [Armatimonadetes bacterium]|nr:glycerophosphodiester phosphodiesterase [Armatimonadota bacterium]